MTPQEALARIAALCDERLRRSQGPALIESVGLLTVAEVRAVLAEVTPETGGTLDRDQARAVLRKVYKSFTAEALAEDEWVLDRLATCVRPATIDRDALVHEFRAVLHEYRTRGYGAENPPVEVALADLVLALVRPVAAKQYPYRDGPHLILGPECFTGDGDEVPQDVIMWRGVAYSNGVTLTPEEAALAAEAVRSYQMRNDVSEVRALAARLEATS